MVLYLCHTFIFVILLILKICTICFTLNKTLVSFVLAWHQVVINYNNTTAICKFLWLFIYLFIYLLFCVAVMCCAVRCFLCASSLITWFLIYIWHYCDLSLVITLNIMCLSNFIQFTRKEVMKHYCEYVNNFTNSMNILEKGIKKKPKFLNFLKRQMLQSGTQLSLQALLLKPIQRFPHYLLFLQVNSVTVTK